MKAYADDLAIVAPPEIFRARHVLRPKYGFAIPTTRAIEAIVPHSPIIEVGAGLGLWAWMIEQAGGEVVATDLNPPEEVDPHADRSEMRHEIHKRGVSEQMREYPAFTEIYEHDHTVVEEYPDHSLMLIWPSFHEPWPGEALELYDGDTLIYVGEGEDMATGDAWFHEQIESESWTLLESIQIPSWPGIHDRLKIYERDSASA